MNRTTNKLNCMKTQKQIFNHYSTLFSVLPQYAKETASVAASIQCGIKVYTKMCTSYLMIFKYDFMVIKLIFVTGVAFYISGFCNPSVAICQLMMMSSFKDANNTT